MKKEIKKTKMIESKNLIVKANQLVEANYRLSIGEQKVLYILISSINKNDEDFKKYEFNISDFLELLEVKNNKKYDEVKKITYSLLGRRLSIYDVDKKTLLQVNWLCSAEYKDGQGIVELEFSPKLKPYLLQIKKEFTKFDMKNVMQMRSCYSTRIYELLVQYKSIGSRTFTVEELKKKLGINDNEYVLFANFKAKVILQAQKEINLKTDIKFDFEEIKTSRKITSIKFCIISTFQDVEFHEVVDENKVTSKSLEATESKCEIETCLNMILDNFKQMYKADLNKDLIKKLILEKGTSYIMDCLDKYPDYTRDRNIKNIAGDFYTFCKKGYSTPVQKIGIQNKIPRYANFEQREYTDEEFESLYAIGGRTINNQ